MFLTLFMEVVVLSAPTEAVSESSGQVWQVGARRWNSAEEQRFARWVESTVTEDFFVRHKIAVDCADVLYAIRWIYARIAHLPAAFTLPDGQLMGHWSTTWRELPTSREWYRDRRFRQSLTFVLEKTSTRTLPKDTYPIRIDPEALSAGSAFIDDSHSGIIGRIVLDGSTYSPLQTWEATLPRRVMKLRERDYFGSGVDPKEGTGLVRFRWPVFVSDRWRYLPVEKQPWYSLEQYSPDFSNTGESFDRAVARRIDPDRHDPEKGARLIIDSLRRYLLERVKLVRDGFVICQKNGCPEESILWEEYSTPGRDEVIASQIVHLRRLIRESGHDENYFKQLMADIIIPISEQRGVTMDYVVDNHLWLSHDPNDSIEARWGLAKCGMIRSRIKRALTDLEFTERRYRTTDPGYADRRWEYTVYELNKLRDQGRRAGCDDFLQPPHKASRQPVILPIRISE